MNRTLTTNSSTTGGFFKIIGIVVVAIILFAYFQVDVRGFIDGLLEQLGL